MLVNKFLNLFLTKRKGLIMKKVLFGVLLSVVFVIGLFGSNTSASAAEEVDSSGKLTSEQLEEMNEALENLKNKANKKLEDGEENFVVSTNVSFQDEPLEMEFEADEVENNQALSSNSTSAVQEKNFSHTVKNTAGFNFSHRVFGSFTYESGDVNNYSADSDLTGALYSKSHNTKVDRLDSSVAKVRSSGTFKALKYAPIEYKTRIDIGLYGSGDYRVLKASLN